MGGGGLSICFNDPRSSTTAAGGSSSSVQHQRSATSAATSGGGTGGPDSGKTVATVPLNLFALPHVALVRLGSVKLQLVDTQRSISLVEIVAESFNLQFRQSRPIGLPDLLTIINESDTLDHAISLGAARGGSSTGAAAAAAITGPSPNPSYGSSNAAGANDSRNRRVAAALQRSNTGVNNMGDRRTMSRFVMLSALTPDNLGIVGLLVSTPEPGYTLWHRQNRGLFSCEVRLFMEAFSPLNAKHIPLIEPIACKVCASMDEELFLGFHLNISWININLSLDTTQTLQQWISTLVRGMHLRYLIAIDDRKEEQLSGNDYRTDPQLSVGGTVELSFPDGEAHCAAEHKSSVSSAGGGAEQQDAVRMNRTSTSSNQGTTKVVVDNSKDKEHSSLIGEPAYVHYVSRGTGGPTQVTLVFERSGMQVKVLAAETCRSTKNSAFQATRAASRYWVFRYPSIFRSYLISFLAANEEGMLKVKFRAEGGDGGFVCLDFHLVRNHEK